MTLKRSGLYGPGLFFLQTVIVNTTIINNLQKIFARAFVKKHKWLKKSSII